MNPTDAAPHPLLGLAVGDALGTPFEDKPHYHPQLLGWDEDSYGDSTFHRTCAGEWTDDTGMALALATSLIQNRGFDPVSVQTEYLSWYRGCKNNPNSMGGTIRASLEALDRASQRDHPGVGALGNGTIMRILPLGVCYHFHHSQDDVEAWLAFAGHDACITHRSALCSYGSMALAWIAAKLMGSTQGVLDVVDAVQTGMGELFPNGPFDAALTRVVSRCNRAMTLSNPRVRPVDVVLSVGLGQPPVVETLCTALACLALTRSYRDAVVLAIQAGGDTDTRAAITGGLAAIRRPIPSHWLDGLSRRTEIHDVEASLLSVASEVVPGLTV